MSKCQYRKSLEDIIEKEDLFYEINFFWKMRELKIRCMHKILEKKMFKSNSPFNQKKKSIDTWNNKIENEIEIWIGNLSGLKLTEDNSQYEEEIEILISLIIEDLYLNAQYKFQNKQYSETSAVLGIAEKIIKIFWSFCKNVKLIHSCQKIYLFISSLLISDDDLTNAINYQDRVFILAFRELFLRIDAEEGLYYESATKGHQHCLNKLFLNIIKAFYQRGNCEERLGNMSKGIECYKQAQWFLNNSVKFQVPELSQFLTDVDLRAKQFHILVRKVIERYNYNKYILNNKKLGRALSPQQEEELIKRGSISFFNSEKKDKNKKKKIIQIDKDEEFHGMLEKIKHQEFEFLEDDKKSGKIKQIMSTLNLLNNFSSEKFKDIIKDMKSLNIENMDPNMIEKIQKRLNDIRAEKHFCEIEKISAEKKIKDRFIETNNLKAELEQYFSKDGKSEASNLVINNLSNKKFDAKLSSQVFLNTEKYLADKVTDISSPMLKTKSNYNMISEGKKSNILDTNPSSSRLRPSSYRVKIDPSKKIKKYEHDEYIFSSNYQSKIKGINDFMRRETDFQKQLLHLKKYEKLPMEITEIDLNALKSEAKGFFERTKSACKSGFIFSHKEQANKSKTKKEIEKNRLDKKKEKLEVALIKSCDSKIYLALDKLKKNEEKCDNHIREEFLINEKSKILDYEERNKINQQFSKKVEKELGFLEKKENMCKKIIEQDNQILKSYLQNKKRFSNKNLIENLITPTDSNLNSRPVTSKKGRLRLLDTENLNDNLENTKCFEKPFMANILTCKNMINKNFCLDQFVGYDKLKLRKDSNFPSTTKLTINSYNK